MSQVIKRLGQDIKILLSIFAYFVFLYVRYIIKDVMSSS